MHALQIKTLVGTRLLLAYLNHRFPKCNPNISLLIRDVKIGQKIGSEQKGTEGYGLPLSGMTLGVKFMSSRWEMMSRFQYCWENQKRRLKINCK